MKSNWIGALLACLVVITVATDAAAQDWEMVQKDAQHTGSLPKGAEAPLRRSWIEKSSDPESSFTTWPVAKGGVVYARSGPGVIAVEAATGKRLWWRENPEGSKQVSLALDDRAIYVPLPLEKLVALDLATGDELWKVDTGVTSQIDASPVLADGRLFFGLPDADTFQAVDVTDGRTVWSIRTPFNADSVPAASGGRVVFTMQDSDSPRSVLLALDAASGRELWRVENQVGNSSPSIFEGKVVFGGGDRFAYALDLKTGRRIWRSPTEDVFSPRNMPAIAFGDVFLADRIGNLYRLDGETGKRKWIFRDTEGTMDQSFPVIAGTTLFIGSGSGWIYAVDTESGDLLWKEQVGGFVLSGAADEKHFYFGVKFRNEGLYAYEHDPSGKAPNPVGGLVDRLTSGVALALALVILAGLVLLIVVVSRRAGRR
ncbi:MAG: PQQ-binding-like beta-propeller repeat protein [Gaiellales bacterium]